MGKFLTIDIGNTRTKYELWNGNKLIKNGLITLGRLKFFRRELCRYNICELIKSTEDLEAVAICSVGEDPNWYISEIDKETGGKLPVINFDQKEIERYKGKIDYEGEIGADRIAAWLGAESLAPELPKLIVDAGTAITLDVSDKEGRFRGGNISLGLNGRLKALNEQTEKLPLAQRKYPEKIFGNHTLEALLCGAINGVVGEIIYTMRQARDIYGAKSLWLTGGDAELIRKHLPERSLEGVDIRIEPHLVGYGLLDAIRKEPEGFLKQKRK